MGPNTKAIEKLAIAGVLDPQTVVNSEVFSTVVDLQTYHQVMAVLALGNMSNETVDFRALRCDSDGNNAVELKKATQRAASATANDLIQIAINVTADDLIATGARYVKFGVVTGGASGGPASIIVLGVDAHYGPVTNPAAVKQALA